MSYFMSPQTHLGLLASGQGGAAPSASSLGLYSPAEPMVVAPGQLGLLSQKAEQVTPAAQAWGPALAAPEARGFPRGTGWEMLPWRKGPSRYCHTSPHLRQPESLGWEDGGSRSRAAQLHGPNWPRPLLLCGLSTGALPVSSEVGGKEADSQPDICILTLAMMIAGIPTVPVPGLQEEDLIRAAQAFMMAHPEPEGAVEGCGGNRCISMQPLGRCP